MAVTQPDQADAAVRDRLPQIGATQGLAVVKDDAIEIFPADLDGTAPEQPRISMPGGGDGGGLDGVDFT